MGKHTICFHSLIFRKCLAALPTFRQNQTIWDGLMSVQSRLSVIIIDQRAPSCWWGGHSLNELMWTVWKELQTVLQSFFLLHFYHFSMNQTDPLNCSLFELFHSNELFVLVSAALVCLLSPVINSDCCLTLDYILAFLVPLVAVNFRPTNLCQDWHPYSVTVPVKQGLLIYFFYLLKDALYFVFCQMKPVFCFIMTDLQTQL